MATYPSRVDGWLAVALVLPIVGGVAAVVAGLRAGEASVLWIGVGALAFYGLLLWSIVVPMRYRIEADGLHIQSGALNRLALPWSRLRAVEISSNPLSSPALSLRRLRVDYDKPSGKASFVLISPPDREAFLRALAEASPRHHLVDGRLVVR